MSQSRSRKPQRNPKPLLRQQRKAIARRALRLATTDAERKEAAFRPILWNTHPHGPRAQRQHARAYHRDQVGEGWRRKKYIRGEYYGRKLEQLIRSRAPFARVQAERKIIRALLA